MLKKVKDKYKKWVNSISVKKIYKNRDYLDAYSKHTDIRVEKDPHSAVGGFWDEMGKLQFDFLIRKGLQPNNNLLDIGCGTLRAGKFFITYLESGNYFGIDISQKAIQYAERLIKKENLGSKNASLIFNKEKNLKFNEFQNQKFDFILAQSVFTHLKPEHIEECFQNIKKIMHKNSKFFFTYKKSEKFKQIGVKGFKYPFSFFQRLADEYSFKLKDFTSNYPHPRKQNMVMLNI
jgi:SAM-dependent methyltransferase